MKKKAIQLPFNIENKFLTYFLQSKLGILISNWTTQGMRYMNKYERLYRILLEITIITTCSLLLAQILDSLSVILVSFIIVHTLFWVFNGHIYVLMRYISNRRNDPAKFISYVKKMQNRVSYSRRFFLAVVAFGSLSKGQFNASSDFDVRFIRRKGLITSIMAFNYCTFERTKAFLNAFPLDAYVFDLEDINKKIESDERPIIMFDPNSIFGDSFKGNKMAFDEFYDGFCERFIGNL